jgi:hypothetical protein
MSQMLMSGIPGFFDLADSTIAAGQPGTDYALQKISHNAKFGAVRCEIIYMGFYGPGDTVSAPVSPVDGYQYSYGECFFFPILYSMRQPLAGYTPGQATPPALANLDLGSGNPIVSPYCVDVNDANGKVTIQEYFLGGAYGSSGGGGGGAFNQGTVKVFAICQRLSVNLPAGVSGD